jgi:diaminopimelate epimerase
LGLQRFAATVWERGAGATQACGTGACAVAAAAIARGLAKADEPISVELPGGTLTLRMQGSTMKMRGEAVLVFRGELTP